VQRIDAAGGVVVTRGDQRASGNSAVYDIPRRIITMVGNVALRRGKDTLNGGRLVIDLNTGLSSVDGRSGRAAGRQRGWPRRDRHWRAGQRHVQRGQEGRLTPSCRAKALPFVRFCRLWQGGADFSPACGDAVWLPWLPAMPASSVFIPPRRCSNGAMPWSGSMWSTTIMIRRSRRRG
jgi:hypothetical protein